MDTESKRRSAALEGFILPTGTIDAAAREAAPWLYNGNAAGGGAPPAPGLVADLAVFTGCPHAGVRYETRRHVYKVGD